MNEQAGLRVRVKGIVQGVGFRPFVYRLAQRLSLRGWVRNSDEGVDIEVDGDKAALQELLHALRWEAPALASIDRVEVADRSPNGFTTFEIKPSLSEASGFQPVSPDLSICPDCLRELFDPNDRHYRYPFVNCTNCGPRFTIIRDLPYDRPQTTMAEFSMCPACAAEYGDPANRRYHAQPVSCPECGPRIWLAWGQRIIEDREESISLTRQLVAEGEIVAIKGLGGFHLACDASNPNAVAILRHRKDRPHKPLALMMPDIETVRRHCELNQAELAELESPARPIVLLRRKSGSTIAEEVAPGHTHLGVMLPYTPLHYLLLERAGGIPEAWVMTSGNRSEEPILTGNDEAREQLGHIASAFLLHDRPIQERMDDSVVRVEGPDHRSPLRRARGFAPTPIHLEWSMQPTLATGAELKNTFGLGMERYAFVSQHIGDLSNFETLAAYEKAIAHYEHLFRIKPAAIAYDLHPDYLSTRYALARAAKEGLPSIAVQHHHAHIASCMAEHGLPAEARVIGFAFDGTGYGTDGAIWGGEVLVASYTGFQRAYHLNYVPMPGGDLAVKQPWRMALAWLNKLEIAGAEFNLKIAPKEFSAAWQQLASGLNAPSTSSIGRLFDAVAALVGLRSEVSYEGQAAIELENHVDPSEDGAYAFTVAEGTFSALPVIAAVLADVRAGLPVGLIAARFHNGLADLVLDLAQAIRQRDGLESVALSGGVWQNLTLLAAARARLEGAGFHVYSHEQVPANDGGLALGQLAIAHHTREG
ncbi:MAG: carbamoyltransferase HypF [Anaerolineales bacterium]